MNNLAHRQPEQQPAEPKLHLDLAQRIRLFAFGANEEVGTTITTSQRIGDAISGNGNNFITNNNINNNINYDRQLPNARWPPTQTSPQISGSISSDDNQLSSEINNSNNTTTTNYFTSYVNLNSVREMVAQHAIELVLILVIITYLIYYFTQISRRPKLIGDAKSKFVTAIKSNLSEILTNRFSPPIYFWGTNPQTCTFGLFHGQTTDEKIMPRSKFKRQYLYISDAQYLTSNVDLSSYYRQAGSNKLVRKSIVELGVQLNASTISDELQSSPGSQLDENLRLVLSGMLEFGDEILIGKNSPNEQQQQQNNKPQQQQQQQLGAPPLASVTVELAAGRKSKQPQLLRAQLSLSSSSSSGCSSADSGVFNGSRTNSSSGSGPASRASSASSLNDEACSSSTGSRSTEGSTIGDSMGSCEQSSGSSSKAVSSDEEGETSATNSLTKLKKANTAPTPGKPSSNNDTPTLTLTKPLREHQEFGQCALDWYLDSHQNYVKHKRVAIISAGMTTGSDKKYVTDTVTNLESLGYEVCVFIRRGVGGLTLSSPKFFSPSKWRDFEAGVLSVRQQRPDAQIVAVGFSFGSVELCRYLAMTGYQSQVDAALLISCPFDPEAGGRNMRRTALNRKIDAYLAKNLGTQLHWALFNGPNGDQYLSTSGKETNEAGKGNNNNSKLSWEQQRMRNYNGSFINLASLPKIKSLVEFEDEINRRIQNYPNSKAYADDSRLSNLLKMIQTPTLCISSEDDFMAPLHLLPIEEIKANPNLCMILTRLGGHMGFIDGIFWPKQPYFAQRVIHSYAPVMDQLLKAKASKQQAPDSHQFTAPLRNKQHEVRIQMGAR